MIKIVFLGSILQYYDSIHKIIRLQCWFLVVGRSRFSLSQMQKVGLQRYITTKLCCKWHNSHLANPLGRKSRLYVGLLCIYYLGEYTVWGMYFESENKENQIIFNQMLDYHLSQSEICTCYNSWCSDSFEKFAVLREDFYAG